MRYLIIFMLIAFPILGQSQKTTVSTPESTDDISQLSIINIFTEVTIIKPQQVRVWNSTLEFTAKFIDHKSFIALPEGRYNIEITNKRKEKFTYKDFYAYKGKHATITFDVGVDEDFLPPPHKEIDFLPMENTIQGECKLDSTIHFDSTLCIYKVIDFETKEPIANAEISIFETDFETTSYYTNEDGELRLMRAPVYGQVHYLEHPKYHKIRSSFEMATQGKSRVHTYELFKINNDLIPADPILIQKVDDIQPVKKPVIYLYPEAKTDFNINIKTKADITFTYPALNDGWKGTANPDGTIEMNGTTYPYLFWEGEIKLDANKGFDEGYNIKQENLISFFEEELSGFGLNNREITDFITYWVPQMQSSPYYFIHFDHDVDYTENIGALEMDIRPDTELRLFMHFKAMEEPLSIQQQIIPYHERKGFVLVEWGGGELPYLPKAQ